MKNYIKIGYLILISPIVIWQARDIISYYVLNNVIPASELRRRSKK